jgi:hypothetical protein
MAFIYIGCSFKFPVKVAVEEESITDLTSLFALFVFSLCRLTSGAFTIDSSAPTLTGILNEHPIHNATHYRRKFSKIAKNILKDKGR